MIAERGQTLDLRGEVLAFLLLLALATAVYTPSLPGGLVSDDFLYLEYNELLDPPFAVAFPRIIERSFFANWAPVHILFLYAERAAFGDEPLGHRIANVILLAGCAFALRRVALRGGLAPGAALAAAALLAVHPAAVEAVAWITQSKTLLALVFSLLSLERWLAHLQAPSTGRLAAALALAVLALLSKGAVVLLPAVFAVAWWSHGRGALRDAWSVALLAAVAGYVALMNVQAQATQGGVVEWFGGSAGATARIVPEVLWRHLRMAAFPVDPAFCVHPDPVSSWSDARAWLPLVGIAAAIALAFIVARRDRRSWLALAWVAAMLLPVVQLVPMTTVYADRYLFLALPGLLVLGVSVAAQVGGSRLDRRTALAATALVVAALGIRSAFQARLWADPEALYLQSVTAYPSSRHGWTGLGGELHRRGALDEAADAYRRALAIAPGDGHARSLLARLRLEQGAREQALFHLEGALRDAPLHPDADWMRGRVRELRSRGVVSSDEPR